MRKICIMMFLLLMALSAVSCGNQSKNQPLKQTTTPKTSVDTVATKSPTPSTTSPTPAATAEVNKRDMSKYRITDKIHSEALKNNMVGEETDREVCIYLPPSYFDCEKKYPVLYYLHGHGEGPRSWFLVSGLEFDKVAEKTKQEFIVVYVDGAAQNGGAFYVNSPVSGNWEDYIVNEVVSYVDKTYRTLANKDSRGILGFSMGGFGALNLGMRHPNVFGAAYGMSPGLIAKGEIKSLINSSDINFKTSYGRAFSPNTKDPEELAYYPTFDGSKEDNKIVQAWENGFGNFDAKIKDYLSKKDKLRGIKIIYGTNDNYSWIPRGCEALIKEFKKNKIECEHSNFDGAHQIKPNAVKEDVVPFFSKNLVVE